MADIEIERLKAEHARLEAQLDDETHRPLPDQQVLKQIKRQKLKIKDQLALLERAVVQAGQ